MVLVGSRMKKLGLIVNPIAGMGGRVGLKGTDGTEALRKALELGAKPEAEEKTARALEKLLPLRDELVIVTCSGVMGENVARRLGFTTEAAYSPRGDVGTGAGSGDSVTGSTAEDTRAAARAIAERGVDLLLFAGGDGTARDIYEAIGDRQLVLGIPAGVKIHSPVYANSPRQAGELALLYMTGRSTSAGEREVLDINVDAVRRDVLETSLYGYLRVPLSETYIQCSKLPTAVSEQTAQNDIAADIVENMEEGTCYIIGPGTTTRAIMQALGLPFTLLGVDVVLNRRLAARDVSERELLHYVETYPCKLVLAPVGGQGYLLGRGNQQISAQVVKKIGKDNLIVVATSEKLLALQGRPLLVDTGDPAVNAMLAGYHRVKTGYHMDAMHRIEAG